MEESEAVEAAMEVARAVVTSVLADDPETAIVSLTECPGEIRLSVTLALATMVAASMEQIADLHGLDSASEAWSNSILMLLAAQSEE